MAHVEKRTVSLPREQAGYADELVARGAYGSVSEVVRAGIRALQERDAAVDRWLSKEVAATYDTMRADPSRALPAETVAQNLRLHHAMRLKRELGA